MELTAEMDVLPGKGLSGAKVVVQLMYVPLREPSNTRDDTFTGLCDFGFGVSSGFGLCRKWEIGTRPLGLCPGQPVPQFFFVFYILPRSPF